MEKLLTALFLLFMVANCAVASDFMTVKNAKIEGAIVPSEKVLEWHESIRKGRGAPNGIQNMLGVEAQSFWTPQAQDIAIVETRLHSVLEKAAKEPTRLASYATTEENRKYISQQIQQILKHYSEYKRQYVGLVIDGKRHIYLNSFFSRAEMSYTKRFIMVDDGGFWYWHILYSIDDGTFSMLSINGDA